MGIRVPSYGDGRDTLAEVEGGRMRVHATLFRLPAFGQVASKCENPLHSLNPPRLSGKDSCRRVLAPRCQICNGQMFVIAALFLR